jgi:hypothetical protein
MSAFWKTVQPIERRQSGDRYLFGYLVNERRLTVIAPLLPDCRQRPTKQPKTEALKEPFRHPMAKQLTNGGFACFRIESCLSALPNISEVRR